MWKDKGSSNLIPIGLFRDYCRFGQKYQNKVVDRMWKLERVEQVSGLILADLADEARCGRV